jgi:hypothetical protein
MYNAYAPYTFGSLSFLEKPLPTLVDVTLVMCPMGWPALTGLTQLTLGFYGQGARPTWPQIKQTLVASPLLSALGFAGGVSSTPAEQWDADGLQLLSLASLTLTGVRGDEATAILTWLFVDDRAPLLNTLTVATATAYHHGYDLFINQLQSSCVAARLQHLKILSLYTDPPLNTSFFNAFHALTSLQIDFGGPSDIRRDSEDLWRALLNSQLDVPELVLSRVAIFTIQELVSHRVASGREVKRLVVYSTQRIPVGHQQWLRDHIKDITFKLGLIA